MKIAVKEFGKNNLFMVVSFIKLVISVFFSLSFASLHAEQHQNEPIAIKIFNVTKLNRVIKVELDVLKKLNIIHDIVEKEAKFNRLNRSSNGLQDSSIHTIISWNSEKHGLRLLIFDKNGNMLTYSRSIVSNTEAIRLSTQMLLILSLRE
jgi:hypothetical protein